MKKMTHYTEKIFCLDENFNEITNSIQKMISLLLLENKAVGIVAGYYDDKYSISFVSEFALNLLNYTYEEFINKTNLSLYNILDNNKKEIDSFPINKDIKLRVKGKDNYVFLNVRISNVTLRSKKLWVASIRDVDNECKSNLASQKIIKILTDNYVCIYEFDIYNKKITCLYSIKKSNIGKVWEYENNLESYGKGYDYIDSSKVKKFFNLERITNEYKKGTLHEEEKLERIIDDELAIVLNCLDFEYDRPGIVIYSERNITNEIISNAALDSMVESYSYINYVNLNKNKIREIYPKLSNEYRDYEKEILDRINKEIIYKTDFERAKEFLSIESIKKELKSKSHIDINYRRWNDSNAYEWYRVTFTALKRNDDGTPTMVIMSIKNINDIINGINYSNKINQLLDKLYLKIMIVNLKDFTFDYYLNKLYTNINLNINSIWESYVDLGMIYKNDINSYKNFLNLESIKERLDGGINYDSLKFRMIYNNEIVWCICEIIKDSLYDKNNIALITIRKIDNRFTYDDTELIDSLNKELINNSNSLLQKALTEAERANYFKSEFLSRMSHDMRTPMNAIIGFTTLAKKHLDDPKCLNDYLNKIEISSNQLLSLINDVLDINKVERGMINLESIEFNFLDLIEENKIIIQTLLKSKEIKLIIENNLKNINYIGSPLHIKQIILNILTNCVNYNVENGTITLKIDDEAIDDNSIVTICISDTGQGMSPEYLERIFEPFSQEENITRSYIGTGLGMSIVKRLVDIMNGDIKIISKKNFGTTFTIKIPLKINKNIKLIDKAVEKEYGNKNIHVLLVDDNELNIEVAREFLIDAGITVDVANNGIEAIKKYNESTINEYSCILMDVRMPIMDGIEATKIIRKSDRIDSSLPIFALTADAYSNDVKKILDSGMNGHFAKPLKMNEVIEKIFNYCK